MKNKEDQLQCEWCEEHYFAEDSGAVDNYNLCSCDCEMESSISSEDDYSAIEIKHI